MSWIPFLINVGIGFAKGYAEGARRTQQTFGEYMAQLGQAAGYPVVSVEPESVAFKLRVGAESYVILAILDGEYVWIDILSNITFPCGQAPPDVCQFLAERNRTLPHCDYDVLNLRKGDQFFVKTKVRGVELTPAVFDVAVREMAPRIAALDVGLVKHGLA